jgi:hypothetical protein
VSRTSARAKLSLVADEPLDITLAMRAEINARDWGRVHVEGDRAPAFVWERIKRTWIR